MVRRKGLACWLITLIVGCGTASTTSTETGRSTSTGGGTAITLSGGVSGRLTQVAICHADPSANQAVVVGDVNGGNYLVAVTGGGATWHVDLDGGGTHWSATSVQGDVGTITFTSRGGHMQASLQDVAGSAAGVYVSGSWVCA